MRCFPLRSLVIALGLIVALMGESIWPVLAGANGTPATVETCFTPGMDCQGYLVALINQTPAPQQIVVQAYSFTSAPIAKALIDAHKRGVKVMVLLDSSQMTEKYSSATFFANAGIPLAIDAKEAIAHNKVMVFPERTLVVTGSFNFTKSAQERNAENVVILSGSADLVQRYLANITQHWQHSQAYARR